MMHYNFTKEQEIFSIENHKEVGDIRLVMNKFMLVFRIERRRFYKDIVYWRDYRQNNKVS